MITKEYTKEGDTKRIRIVKRCDACGLARGVSVSNQYEAFDHPFLGTMCWEDTITDDGTPAHLCFHCHQKHYPIRSIKDIKKE